MDATITVVCDHCGAGAVYKPSAIAVTIYTHGVIVMEFFCVKCREENRRVIGMDLAEHLALVGVQATVVRTPLELMEHPSPDTPPITEVEVELFADRGLETFNRLLRFEVGDKKVWGDVEPG
jgi:hypothetical protein